MCWIPAQRGRFALAGAELSLDDAWELSRRYQFDEAVDAFSDKIKEASTGGETEL